jgi:hypothetical protein
MSRVSSASIGARGPYFYCFQLAPLSSFGRRADECRI